MKLTKHVAKKRCATLPEDYLLSVPLLATTVSPRRHIDNLWIHGSTAVKEPGKPATSDPAGLAEFWRAFGIDATSTWPRRLLSVLLHPCIHRTLLLSSAVECNTYIDGTLQLVSAHSDRLYLDKSIEDLVDVSIYFLAIFLKRIFYFPA
ncbi:hypothetical protein AMS68_007853 [Peltaster fructicola]|uniref:Uncharacterized protein n=1 Tax=Peltaster fructicola TaxID=286661 RepID=A0A6H0Y5T6_9PEZI|nr:hypothetical protein AMS68_007853 [Peltaster fructicola]